MSAMQKAGGVEPWMQSYDVSQTRGLVVCLLNLQMLVRCTILLRVRCHLEAMHLSPIRRTSFDGSSRSGG